MSRGRTGKQVAPERYQAQRVLYDAGWTDPAIGKAFGLGAQTIANWRMRENLPRVASVYAPKINHERALEMHEAGASDGEIARKLGATQSGVTRWRQRHGLPPNFERIGPIDPSQRRAGRKMLRRGASRAQVASFLGVSIATVRRLRRGMAMEGLRSTGVTNRTVRAMVLRDRTLERRILAAIGPCVPIDVRSDAMADLYADVLEGKVAAQFIEQVAPSYRSRAYEMCGSRFGARSLDEETDDGWSLMETIEDADAYSAMERAAEEAFGQRHA